MAKATTKKSSAATDAPAGSVFRKELVLGALVAELLGSAVLSFAALATANNPILAAVAVIVLVMVFGEVSGGYINPVVVAGAWATKQLSWIRALGYIAVQFLGAMLAYVIVAKFMKDGSVFTLFTKPDDASVLQGIAAPREPGQWKPVFGELVGAMVFGFGFASALLYKKVGFEKAFTVGGALMIGLVAALVGSYAVVNPAVATALGGYARGGWWSALAYGIAPLVGGALGAWLFKLLKRDVETARSR